MMPGIRAHVIGGGVRVRVVSYSALAAGSIAPGTHTSTQINATCTAPTGGSGSFTYQWYNGADASAISGATSTTLVWTGRAASTAYTFYVVATDTITDQTVQYTTANGTTEAAGDDHEPTYNLATSLFTDDFESYANGAAILAGPWSGNNGQDANIQTTVGNGGGTAGRIVYSGTSGGNPALTLESQWTPSGDFYIQFDYRVTAGTLLFESGIKFLETWRTPPSNRRWTDGVGTLANMDGPAGFVNTGNEFSVHDNSWQDYATSPTGATQVDWNPFIQNVSKGGTFALTADGNWHRYTQQVRLEDGYGKRIWTDGVLRLSTFAGAPGVVDGGFSMEGGTIFLIRWGDDRVGTSNQAFNLDLDNVRIWRRQ